MARIPRQIGEMFIVHDPNGSRADHHEEFPEGCINPKTGLPEGYEPAPGIQTLPPTIQAMAEKALA